MKKYFLVLSLVTVFSVVVISLITVLKPVNIKAEQLNKEIISLENSLNEAVSEKSELAYSSNPYDYVKNNESYKKIVAMGYEVIPLIQDRIDKSENDGLCEYILAIAAEDISKTNLKTAANGEYSFSTAKEWSQNLTKFKENLDSIIIKINQNQDVTIRNKELEKLGIYALPYLAEMYNSDESIGIVIYNISKNIPELQSNKLSQDNLGLFLTEKKEIIDNIKDK